MDCKAKRYLQLHFLLLGTEPERATVSTASNSTSTPSTLTTATPSTCSNNYGGPITNVQAAFDTASTTTTPESTSTVAATLPSPGPGEASTSNTVRQSTVPSDPDSTSDEFSEDEASTPSNGNNAQADKPIHERIDTRIQAQKDKIWKGNGTWKGKIGKMDDPRPSAIIPIHAPKMERMT